MPGVRLLRIESGNKREVCRSHTARGFSQFKANDSIAGCTAALPLPLDTARRVLNNSPQGGQRVLRRFNHGQPNKSLEMTGWSVNVIRKIGSRLQFLPASQFQRSVASH
jgi:hypothetical protein